MATAFASEKQVGDIAPALARRFDFARDSFAFANELFWEYRFDAATGKTTFERRQPPPQYAHRCFVLILAARQFLYHARFDPVRQIAADKTYRDIIRKIVSRNPRRPSIAALQVVIPGYAGLREFSEAREALLKAECGGAWRSYVLRSHWRMIFPISRGNQEATAGRLLAGIRKDRSPIVHLVKFPALTINHGVILYDASEAAGAVEFRAYDPNDPCQATTLTFDRASQSFSFPKNRYWAGGGLDVIEIYCSWLL